MLQGTVHTYLASPGYSWSETGSLVSMPHDRISEGSHVAKKSRDTALLSLFFCDDHRHKTAAVRSLLFTRFAWYCFGSGANEIIACLRMCRRPLVVARMFYCPVNLTPSPNRICQSRVDRRAAMCARNRRCADWFSCFADYYTNLSFCPAFESVDSDA